MSCFPGWRAEGELSLERWDPMARASCPTSPLGSAALPAGLDPLFLEPEGPQAPLGRALQGAERRDFPTAVRNRPGFLCPRAAARPHRSASRRVLGAHTSSPPAPPEQSREQAELWPEPAVAGSGAMGSQGTGTPEARAGQRDARPRESRMSRGRTPHAPSLARGLFHCTGAWPGAPPGVGALGSSQAGTSEDREGRPGPGPRERPPPPGQWEPLHYQDRGMTMA